jgi:hypothetical protein
MTMRNIAFAEPGENYATSGPRRYFYVPCDQWSDLRSQLDEAKPAGIVEVLKSLFGVFASGALGVFITPEFCGPLSEKISNLSLALSFFIVALFCGFGTLVLTPRKGGSFVAQNVGRQMKTLEKGFLQKRRLDDKETGSPIPLPD